MAEEPAPGASWWVPRQGQSEGGGLHDAASLLCWEQAPRALPAPFLCRLRRTRDWAARERWVGLFLSASPAPGTTVGRSDCQKRFFFAVLRL